MKTNDKPQATMLDPLLDFGDGCFVLHFYGDRRLPDILADVMAVTLAMRASAKAGRQAAPGKTP